MNYFLTIDLTSDLLKAGTKRSGRTRSEPWAAEVVPTAKQRGRELLYTGKRDKPNPRRVNHLGELLTKYKRKSEPYNLIINDKFDEMNPLTGYHEEHGSDPEQIVKREKGESDQKYHERLLAAFVNTEHGHGDAGYQPEHFASGVQAEPKPTPSRAADSEFEDEQHEEQIKTLENILRGNVAHPEDPNRKLGFLPHADHLRPYLQQYAKHFGLTPHVVTPKGPQKFTKIKPTAAALSEDPSLADEVDEDEVPQAGKEKAGEIKPSVTPILHLIQTGRWPYKKLNDAGEPVNDFTSKRAEWASGQLLREMATTLGAAGADVYKKVRDTLGEQGLHKLFGEQTSGEAFASRRGDEDKAGGSRSYIGPMGYNRLMKQLAKDPKRATQRTNLPGLIISAYSHMLNEAENFDPKGKDANSFFRSKVRSNFVPNHYRDLLDTIGGGKEGLVQPTEGEGGEELELDPELVQDDFNLAGDEEDAGAGAAPKLRSPSTARGEALYDAAKGHHLLKQQLGLNIEDPDSVKQYLFYLGRQGILEPYALRDPKKPLTPQTRQAPSPVGGVLSLNMGDTSPYGHYRRFYTPEELVRHDTAMKDELERLKSGKAPAAGGDLTKEIGLQDERAFTALGEPKLSEQQQKVLEASGADPYGGVASSQAAKPIHSKPEAQGRLFAQMVHRSAARSPAEVERGLAATPEQIAPGVTQPEYQDLHRRVTTAGEKLRKIAEEHRQLNRQLAASEGKGEKQTAGASPRIRTIHVKDASGKIVNVDPTSRWRRATSTAVRAKQLRDAHAEESAKATGWLKDRPWETLTPTEIKLLDARVPDTSEQTGDLYTNGTHHVFASEFDKIKKFKERYESHRADAEAAALAADQASHARQVEAAHADVSKREAEYARLLKQHKRAAVKFMQEKGGELSPPAALVRAEKFLLSAVKHRNNLLSSAPKSAKLGAAASQEFFDKARAAHEAEHGAPPTPPAPPPFDKKAAQKRLAVLKQQMGPLQKEYDDAFSAFREAAQRRVVEPARTLQTAAGTGTDENLRGITAHPFAEIDPEASASSWKKVPESLLRMRALDLIEDKNKYATAVKAAYRGLREKLKGQHSRKLADYTLPLARKVHMGREDETTKTPYDKMLAEGADTSEDPKVQKEFEEAREHHTSALQGVLSHYDPKRHRPERGPKESAGRMVDMAEGSLDAATEAAAQAHMDRVYGPHAEPSPDGWEAGGKTESGPLQQQAHQTVRDNVARFTSFKDQDLAAAANPTGRDVLRKEVKGQREAMATMRDRELHRVVAELMNKHYLPYAAHRMHPTDPAARAAFIERHRMLSPNELKEKKANEAIAAAKAAGTELSHDAVDRIRAAVPKDHREKEAQQYAGAAEQKVKQLEREGERVASLPEEERAKLPQRHNEAAGQAQAIKDFLNMQRRATEGGVALTRDLLKPVPAGEEEHPLNPLAHTTPSHGGAFDPVNQDFETFHAHAHHHMNHPEHGKTITGAKDFSIPMSPASFWATHLAKVAAHRDAVKAKAERLGSTPDTLGMTPMTPEELADPSKIADSNPLKLQLAARYKAFADMHDKHYQQAHRSMHATAHAKIIEDAEAKKQATPAQLHRARVTAHAETFPALANAAADFADHVAEHERNDSESHASALRHIKHLNEVLAHQRDISPTPAPEPEDKASSPIAREEAKRKEAQKRKEAYAEKQKTAAAPRTLTPEALAKINASVAAAQAAAAARKAGTAPAPAAPPKAEAPKPSPAPSPTPAPKPTPVPSQPSAAPTPTPVAPKRPSVEEIVAAAQKARAERAAATAPAPTPAPSAGVESGAASAGRQAFMNRFKK